jgi:hypothetical protein
MMSSASCCKVVRPLHFERHTLSATLLWQPWPAGSHELTAPAPAVGLPLEVPDSVLEHRALLTLANGTPISEVVETYTRNALISEPSPPGLKRAQ